MSKAYVWFQSRQDAGAQIGPSGVFRLPLLSTLLPSGSASLADRNSDPPLTLISPALRKKRASLFY